MTAGHDVAFHCCVSLLSAVYSDSRLPMERGDQQKAHEGKENERVTKWQKMFAAWDKYYGSEKVGVINDC